MSQTLVGLLSAFPRARLLPGLNELELSAFALTLPGALRGEIADLFLHASGLHSEELGRVDFTGRSVTFEFPELAPYAVTLAEANGNTWVVDVNTTGTWGSVLYFSHDPPTVAIQFSSLRAFLESVVGRRPIVDDASRLADVVWSRTADAISLTDATRSDDPILRSFALSLPTDFQIFDLRAQTTEPRGFSWGRAGPDSICRRSGSALIFAVETKPAPRRGWASWFRGRAT